MIAKREAIVAGGIVGNGQIARGYAVLVSDGLIDAVLPAGEIPAGVERHDVGSGLLAPGFIDIHTHGAAGRGFGEADPAAFRQALAAYAPAGVTTVLPTLASAPIGRMVTALEVYESVRDDARGPRIPGVHLEGPYFSPAQRGAQDPGALRLPTDGSADRLLEHADSIRVMSFAPELPGAVELTERLVALGIVAAAGHSDGRDTDLAACQRAGLSHVIHVVSGQSTTVREGPWRRPGMLEATLASDGLTVEMIADGKHLPPTLMKLVLRCLEGRVCLVSDSTPGAGMPEGSRYRLGDNECVVEGGVGMTLDRTAFAGSTTLIPEMVPILVSTLGTDVATAVDMVTAVPARAARLDRVGRIAPGYHADFVVLGDDLRPHSVAIAGVWRQSGRGGQDGA